MMLQYKGYCFKITPNTHNSNTLHGECEEIKYYTLGQSYDNAISDFKTKIDELLRKKQEERFMMIITCIYKSYPIKITKEKDSLYFKCTLVGDVYSKPLKISNDSLEKVLHWYKSHIDKFNVSIPYHLMQLTIFCNDRTLGAFEYDPNINKVLGEESSLDKLVTNFEKEVNKEKGKQEPIGMKNLRKHCANLTNLHLDPRALVIELNGLYELYGQMLNLSLEEVKKIYFALAEKE